jgi:galactose mutarotase-like enzyme
VSTLTLENRALTVAVNPEVGGAITGVRHRATGLSVLGDVPWSPVDAPLPGLAARDEPEWLTRYTGGWPLLFPNGGDACTVDGVFHGFHGEASVAPWTVTTRQPGGLVIERHFHALPLFMRRSMTLFGETLTISETVSCTGPSPVEVMWGHHPTFGSALLDGAVEITSGAAEINVEPAFAPQPASADLLRPAAPLASVAYLQGFASAWAAIRRLDDAIAILLRWDARHFPCAWLWHELEATEAAPWCGRTRLIAIEPNTTPCALGLAEAKRRGLPLLRLEPGHDVSTEISLTVFKPSGPIRNPHTASSSS